MKSKLISIPYTIGIIKPHIALDEPKLQQVYEILDKHNFEVFHQRQKIFTKEEVLNLFYKYRAKDFYGQIEEHMLTADSIVLLLINKVDEVWDEELGEDTKLESPITRWKKLIGDKDPAVATSEEGLPGQKVMNQET